MSLPRLLRLSVFARLLAAAALLLAGLAAPAAAPALAAPPLAPASGCGTVVDVGDNTIGSLRWTIDCVAPGATVTFSPSLTSTTLLLTSGEIIIPNRLTIDGSGKPGLTIDANNLSRVFNITTTGTVTLANLVLQHGWAASGPGGAVVDGGGSLWLNQVQVLSSTAASGFGGGVGVANTLTLSATDLISNTSLGNGGGAFANGFVTATNSRFKRNACTGASCQGGGLFANDTASLTATDFISNVSVGAAGGAWIELGLAVVTNGLYQGNRCTGAGCQGGGLNTDGLSLSGTHFISNTSAGQGGGVWANSAAALTNGLLQGNRCTDSNCTGGGLYAQAALTLSGTQLLSNTSQASGGGLLAATAAEVTGGLVQGNQCQALSCQGGGLFISGTLALTATHVINNASLGYGGGVRSSGAARVTDAVFQDNRCTGSNCKGGGLSVDDAASVTGTQFIHNTSHSYGSGAYVVGTSEVTNSLFQDNHCSENSCYGGGLLSSGDVTLTHVNFYSNTSQLGGGGLWAYQAATVTDSHFENNACARDGCVGGGLYGNAGVTLTNTQFISNTSGRGGGVWAENATSIAGGRFERNTCTDAVYCFGGGLATYGALTITGAQFVNNASEGDGGAVAAFAEVAVTNTLFQDNACTVADCLGGALFIAYTAEVLNSSFSGNHATGRGGGVGITATAALTLANVTLSGNSAVVSGGGLYAGGAASASLWNLTLADNHAANGGGLRAVPGATVGVTNTLFANNTGDNCSGAIAAGTHNLEFPAATCAAAGPGAGFTTADPRLAPLALNAPGATLTQALLPDSPARDHGQAASCAAAPVNNVDQRGVVRPLNSDLIPGAICDIGAFEAGPPVWSQFLSLLFK